jgi:signal transduction histidine kinase
MGRRLPGALLPLALLLGLLVGVNALAAAGILAARQSARSAALKDLRLQTEAQARALEAALAALRGELASLTRAAPLVRLVARFDDPGGESRGEATTAAEEALLRALSEHEAVRALALRDPHNAPLILAARTADGLELLPKSSDPPAPIAAPGLFVAQLPVGGRDRRGLLEVWVKGEALLSQAVAVPEGGLALLLDPGEALAGIREGSLSAPVRDPLWSPPVFWTLVRDPEASPLLESVAELHRRYRATLFMNLGVIGLTLALGALALTQAQRAAALEAEKRQQERLRQLERQVLHVERLASVGRLAAGLAHEVNNPLEGMANYLSLLEEDLESGDTGAAQALTARIREGLERVATTTRRLLTLSSPGRLPAEPMDLRRPIRDALELLTTQPRFRDLRLVVELPETPLPVVGDATTLGQLFLNLLLNAAQAQEGSSGELEVRAGVAAHRARVEVADRGSGLANEAREHLFEPFFSTRGSTGLGLAVCHSIALAHGGTIEGHNRRGGGASFVVELPLGGSRPSSTTGAPAASEVREGMNRSRQAAGGSA